MASACDDIRKEYVQAIGPEIRLISRT